MNNSLIAIFCFSLLLALIYLDNKLLKVSKYKIKSAKISEEFNEFKIVHLSDFHSHKYIGGNNVVIKKIDKENPDIIVITGDMVNKYDREFHIFLDLAEALSKKYRIYYILGNHEQRLKNHDLNFILNKLNEFGIKILNNEKLILKRNEKYINIYGIDIPIAFYKLKNKPTNLEESIYKTLKECNENEYNILLAHNPLFFEKYAKYNVDLILSGHVHGGMIRLPFIGGLLSPERKLFPKYSSGIYELNDKKLLVSRGLGHSRPIVRVFNMPEILSITLLSA